MSAKPQSGDKKTLITGAGGFLGSEIVRQAGCFGMSVRCTDRLRSSRVAGMDYRRADILDPDCLKPALDDVSHVIHAAGLAHIFDKSQASQAPFKAVNESGTANVARAAVAAGVRHMILVSSVSVYGPHSSGVLDEAAPCQPKGAYADSKWQAERRAIEITRGTGTALTILRLATVFGEGDPGNISRLIRMIDRRRFVWVGDGSNRKSLLYRGDAARACLAVLQQEPRSGLQIYNVSAPPCQMRQVVAIIARALNCRLPSWRIPGSVALQLARISRIGSIADLAAKWLADDAYDASKIERELEFRTETSLEEGLRREVAWYQSQEYRDADERG